MIALHQSHKHCEMLNFFVRHISTHKIKAVRALISGVHDVE